MALMAFLPGIPLIPFLGLAAGAGYLAFNVARSHRAEKAKLAAGKVAEEAEAPPSEEPIATALKIDELKIELGYALLPLVNAADGSDRLTDQIKALRRSLAGEMGFVMPSVRILDNVQLDGNTYVIKVKETDAGHGQIYAKPVHGHGPGRRAGPLPGHHTHRADLRPAGDLDRGEPARGCGDPRLYRGRCHDRLSTHLTEILKANMADLLSYGEVQKLLKDLPKEQDELVKDLVPSAGHGHRHPARAAAASQRTRLDPRPADDPRGHRRGGRLHPQSARHRRACAHPAGAPALRPVTPAHGGPADPHSVAALGDRLRRGDRRQGDERHLAMQPSKLTEFVHAVRDAFEEAARAGEMPVLSPRPSSAPSCAASSSASGRRRR